jgi:hypothetical protein
LPGAYSSKKLPSLPDNVSKADDATEILAPSIGTPKLSTTKPPRLVFYAMIPWTHCGDVAIIS